MDSQSALILDIGIGGAFLEHYGEVQKGRRFQLSFRWHGEEVAFVSEVVRSVPVRTPGGDGKSLVSHTGVRFVEAVGDASGKLQDMMATFVGRVLSAQKANAGGIDDATGAQILAELGGARRARSRGFMTYRLQDNVWHSSPATTSEQPHDGFTVAAHEDDEELEALCRAYERADDEGRRLIRLVAELSAMSARR